MTTKSASESLRGIAAAAARAFLAEDVSLELLGHGESLACRVTAPGGRFLLRVHAPLRPPADPAFLTVRAIESECTWLRALSDDTDLAVQRPVQGPDGGCVLFVPRAGGGDAVPCTLLTWVEGEHVDGKRTVEQAARLGELLAALQEHAESWQRPPDFERPVHGRASWRAALARTEGLVSSGIATEADRALLTRAVEEIDRELTPLARRDGRAGLIHADLHGDNYVFHRGIPRPIDFGRAGFGPWLYDVAECATHLGPDRRRDMVEAYAKRRPFDDGDVRRVEGYFVASLVEVFGNNAPDPGEHQYLARAVPAWAPHVRRYIEGKPFLFEL